MGVDSLPKTVARQRRDCGFNPGHSVPETSKLTTRLPSHSLYFTIYTPVDPLEIQNCRLLLGFDAQIIHGSLGSSNSTPQTANHLHWFNRFKLFTLAQTD